MDIHDLMSDLGITPETPCELCGKADSSTQGFGPIGGGYACTACREAYQTPFAERSKQADKTILDACEETPATVPSEPVADRKADKGRPVSGKVYALTGKTSIASGNSWAESEVKDEPAPVAEITPWESLMEHRPDGYRFCHGISRRGAPYAFWSGPGRNESESLTHDAKQAWKACQGPEVMDVIDQAWRRYGAAKRNGGLSHNAVADLKDAYSAAREADQAQRNQVDRALAREDTRRASKDRTMAQTAPAARQDFAPHPAIDDLETAYRAFQRNPDEHTAATLSRAMTATLQARE